MSAFDLKALAAWLTDNGLMGKPFCEFDRREVEALCDQVCQVSDPAAGYSPPYLKEGGELVIPVTAPGKYRYWLPGGQSLKATLEEIGAPEEIIRRYSYTIPGGVRL